MDCPSEERLVRLALEDVASVRGLVFDLQQRRLAVVHDAGAKGEVDARLVDLGLGARRLRTEPELPQGGAPPLADDGAERRTLWVLLAINAVMFAGELTAGLFAQSAGLLADALDMLADALVYGIALLAVGRGAAQKRRAARVSGLFQLVLALGLFTEVARRLLFGSEPRPGWMMAVAAVALVANVVSLLLVFRHRRGGLHMKASYIFSANDVLANLGVIAAGLLVAWTGSRMPDLVIGLLIGALVLAGAVRILRLR